MQPEFLKTLHFDFQYINGPCLYTEYICYMVYHLATWLILVNEYIIKDHMQHIVCINTAYVYILLLRENVFYFLRYFYKCHIFFIQATDFQNEPYNSYCLKYTTAKHVKIFCRQNTSTQSIKKYKINFSQVYSYHIHKFKKRN